MKLLFALFFLIICQPIPALAQNTLDGRWNGTIYLQGEQVLFSVLFNTADGEMDGTIDFPQQSEFNLPVEVPVHTTDSLEFSYNAGGDEVLFRVSLPETLPDRLNGIHVQSGVELPFSMIRESAESAVAEEEKLRIDTGSHQISGTLLTPEESVSNSIIILVSGRSGELRNATVAGFAIFEELAKRLSDFGFSTFRYDSRGTGSSTGNPDATLQELGEDLKAVSTYLREEVADSLVYIGHGYGSIVSLLGATEQPPSKVVLLAPPLLPGDEIIDLQIRSMADLQDIPDNVVEENLQFQQRVNEAARADTGWDSLEADIERRLINQIEELPDRQRETLGEMDQFIDAQVRRQLEGSKTRWYRSFISMNPSELLEEQQAPTLLLFAGKDTEITAEANRRALDNINREVLHTTIDEANHLFQNANSGMPGEYGALDQEFADGLLQQVVGFLLQVNRPNP